MGLVKEIAVINTLEAVKIQMEAAAHLIDRRVHNGQRTIEEIVAEKDMPECYFDLVKLIAELKNPLISLKDERAEKLKTINKDDFARWDAHAARKQEIIEKGEGRD